MLASCGCGCCIGEVAVLNDRGESSFSGRAAFASIDRAEEVDTVVELGVLENFRTARTRQLTRRSPKIAYVLVLPAPGPGVRERTGMAR